MSRKILLADDSVTAQNMGKKILSDAGYEVITVSNGSAALKKIAELKPDIAVLDVYMPGHSGLEVCQQLKANPETANLPVLLTVGKLEPFKSDEALKAKANAFIIKPFEASELLAVIRKIEDANPKPAAKSKTVSKGDRFAQAFSPNAVAETPDPDAEVEVTGWKNRISMPGKKKEEPEPPEEDFSGMGTGFRDIAAAPTEASGLRRESPFTADALAENAAVEQTKTEPAEHPLRRARKEISDSKLVSEEDLSPAVASTEEVPLDITPAEIAAIKAAVEMLSGEGDNAPVLHVAAAAMEGITPSSKGLAPEPEYSADVLADPLALTRSVEAAKVDTPKVEIADAEAAREATPAAEAAVEEPVAAAEALPKAAQEPVVATPPVVRWRAEVAELTAAEATGSLEQEMQAALRDAAAETAAHTYDLAQFAETDIASPVDDEPVLSDIPGLIDPVSDVPAAESEPETLAVAAAACGTSNAVSNAGSTATANEELAQIEKPFTQNFAAASSLTPNVASPVASGSEPQISTGFQDLRPQGAGTLGGTTTETATTPDAQVDGFVEMASSAAPAPAPNVDRSAPEDEIDSRTRAQMDAAWSNWHDIRNTIVKSELTDQIADVAEASAKEQAQTASDASRDSSDIANIVDNMLAEMRPKLLEEIARKLAANKKE